MMYFSYNIVFVIFQFFLRFQELSKLKINSGFNDFVKQYLSDSIALEVKDVEMLMSDMESISARV